MSMMERNFTKILEECLSRMDQGETLPEILDAYPHLAEKLKPILLVAMMSRTLPPPAPGHTALRNGKNLLLAEMNAIHAMPDSGPSTSFNERVTILLKRVTQPIQSSLGRIHPVYRLATVVLIMVLTGGYLTVSASGVGNNIFRELFSGFERMGEILRFLDQDKEVLGDFLPGAGFLLDNKGDMLDGIKYVYENDSFDDSVGDPDNGQEQEDLNKDLASGIVLPGDDGEDKEDKEADKEEKEAEKEADKEEDKEEKEEDKEDKEADKEEDKEDKEEEKEDKEDDKEEDKEEKEDDKEEDKEDKEEDKKDKD